MNVEERVEFMNIFLVMKITIIYRYLNKSNTIALDMYLIALFRDEYWAFAMYCTWNKDYNIQFF